jgi:hypothetical protein
MAGDWHGDTGHARSVIDWMAREGAEGIVHLGDFGVWPGTSGQRYLRAVQDALEAAGIWLVFVDGNHDDHWQLRERDNGVPGPVQVRRNLWHLPRGSVLPKELRDSIVKPRDEASQARGSATYKNGQIVGYVVAPTKKVAGEVSTPSWARVTHGAGPGQIATTEVSPTSPVYAAVVARPGWVLVAPTPDGAGEWVAVADLLESVASAKTKEAAG